MTSKTSISFGESLDVSQASSLHRRLTRALQKSSTIELKAESIQKADTAGLQLILALKREVHSRGGKIIWKKPSSALLDATKNLGLLEQLGLDQ